MRAKFKLNIPLRFFLLLIASTGLISCQTPNGADSANNILTYHYTGWPKKSVERLLIQYLESKEFLSSVSREGMRQFDRKGSNWDSIKYGSFLEPSSWLRLETTLKEDKKANLTTLRVEVSLLTHRLSSLEEKRKPKKRHIQEAREVLRYFETMMLQPVDGN